MRSLRTWFFGFAVVVGIAGLAFIFFLRDRYVVPILSYHHVASDFHSSKDFPSLNNVTAKSFAWQMKFIEKHGYHVISFEDYIDGVKKGHGFARNTVVIQFDDGYEDNYTNAFPVLKSYEFPAMVFVISDTIGTPGFLTWAQIKEMDSQGFKIGAHTRRHAYLPEVPLEVAKEEIFGSKKALEAGVGHPIDYFAYPSGGFTEEVAGLVKQAGYKAAVTTNRGRDKFNRRFFEINRIRIKNTENSLTLWAKLSGYYNFFRRPRCGDNCKDME